MKRFVIGVVVLSIVGLLATGEAMAKRDKKNRKNDPAAVAESFKALDKNGDGKLSLDEFKAGKTDAQEAEKSFKSLDKNGDGTLTQDEFAPPTDKPAKPAKSADKVKKNKKNNKKESA